MSFSKVKDKIFYGWVIVAATLVIYATFIGIRFSFGAFFKSLVALPGARGSQI